MISIPALFTALYRNSTGTKVRKIQRFLDSQGYDLGNAGEDGVCGPDTQEAVRDFHHEHALRADGIARSSMLIIMRSEGGFQADSESGSCLWIFCGLQPAVLQQRETGILELQRFDDSAHKFPSLPASWQSQPEGSQAYLKYRSDKNDTTPPIRISDTQRSSTSAILRMRGFCSSMSGSIASVSSPFQKLR